MIEYHLTDQENLQLCHKIASRLGLFYPPDRYTILHRNLMAAARDLGYENFKSFIFWLLSAEWEKDQCDILALHLTVSETYFWREPKVFQAFVDYILPLISDSKKSAEKTLRVWSAGCSSGEEAYSLAIAIHRALPAFREWKVNLLATDINIKALAKAQKAVYTAWSFRNSPAWLKKEYFTSTDDQYFTLIPEIRGMVNFRYLNLIDDLEFRPREKSMDIIFCRNVLMYFTPEWVERISRNFYRILDDEGWFVVASCELSSQVFPQFSTSNFQHAIIYKKGNSTPIEQYEAIVDKDIIPAFPILSIEKKSIEIQPIEIQIDTEPTALETVKVQQEITTDSTENNIDEAITRIRELADRGELKEALLLCETAINVDKLDATLYYLRASILQEMGNLPEATASLKKSIYTDQNFVMGHFSLANLFIRIGNIKQAKHYFKNVVALLASLPEADILPGSGGLSVRYIREIIFVNTQKMGVL